MKRGIGIDIGSSSMKFVVAEDGKMIYKGIYPTGWSSLDAARRAEEELLANGFDPAVIPCVATGYGRVQVPYADKRITEISCHARGACMLFGFTDGTVIDIGGQDTKVISVKGGAVNNFVMNDKCSAGTGRFIEVMANAMGMDPAGLCSLAADGSGIVISSMCTVFAESEVVSLIGQGRDRKDIAYGIVDSIITKVVTQCGSLGGSSAYYLTGGLSRCPYIAEHLGTRLGSPVTTMPDAHFAGAAGAAFFACDLEK